MVMERVDVLLSYVKDGYEVCPVGMEGTGWTSDPGTLEIWAAMTPNGAWLLRRGAESLILEPDAKSPRLFIPTRETSSREDGQSGDGTSGNRPLKATDEV